MCGCCAVYQIPLQLRRWILDFSVMWLNTRITGIDFDYCNSTTLQKKLKSESRGVHVYPLAPACGLPCLRTNRATLFYRWEQSFRMTFCRWCDPNPRWWRSTSKVPRLMFSHVHLLVSFSTRQTFRSSLWKWNLCKRHPAHLPQLAGERFVQKVGYIRF